MSRTGTEQENASVVGLARFFASKESQRLLNKVGVALCAVLVVAQTRPAANSWAQGFDRYEDVYYLPAPDALRWLSLGHREALADVIWMRALVYLGDEFAERGSLQHVFRYTDALLALDPDFRAVYKWIATAALYRPEEVDQSELIAVLPYLRRATARFPDDGEMAWIVGATMLYDIAPLLESAPPKEAIRSEGLAHLQTAARLGAGPPWLVVSNLTQLQRAGELGQLEQHLRDMLPIIDDPSLRSDLLARLESVRGAAEAERFQVALSSYERLWRDRCPWLPFDFFLVLHPAAGTDMPTSHDSWGESPVSN